MGETQIGGQTISVTTQPYFAFKSSPLSEAAMSWRGEQEGTQQFFTDSFDKERSNGSPQKTWLGRYFALTFVHYPTVRPA
jgi:hypothetical protein